VLLTAGDLASKAALPAGVAALMIGRGVFGAVTVAGVVVAEGKPDRLRVVRWRLVALRCVLHTGVSATWYFAWEVIPLADTYAVGFTAPLLMTLLAIPMLGERIRWRRIFSTLIGFSGVLIMVRPGSTLWQPIALLLVPGILLMAVTRIMTRLLSTTETAEGLTFWLMVAHIPAGIVLLTLGFPVQLVATTAVVAGLVLLGALNGVAHCMMARAYALAPVSALAPYEYTMLIWGGIGAFLLFGEMPGTESLIGAAVVAAAGLYNLHRERLRQREAARCSS